MKIYEKIILEIFIDLGEKHESVADCFYNRGVINK